MDLDAFLREVLGLVALAFPEVPAPPYADGAPRRIETEVQAASHSFVEDLRSGTMALPCVVVEVGKRTHDPQWGVGSRTFRRPLAVHYVDRIRPGVNQRTMEAKAAAFAALVDQPAAPFTTFQDPPELAEVDSSTSQPVNAALLVHGKLDVLCASARWDPGLLVYA